MGIFINGVDVSKPPFNFHAAPEGWNLSDLYRTLDKPVRLGNTGEDMVVPGRRATDADFKVWSITGGRPGEAGREPCVGSEGYATDDDLASLEDTTEIREVSGKPKKTTDESRFQDDVTKEVKAWFPEVKAWFPEATVMNLTVTEVEAYLDTGLLPVKSGREGKNESNYSDDDKYKE